MKVSFTEHLQRRLVCLQGELLSGGDGSHSHSGFFTSDVTQIQCRFANTNTACPGSRYNRCEVGSIGSFEGTYPKTNKDLRDNRVFLTLCRQFLLLFGRHHVSAHEAGQKENTSWTRRNSTVQCMFLTSNPSISFEMNWNSRATFTQHHRLFTHSWIFRNRDGSKLFLKKGTREFVRFGSGFLTCGSRPLSEETQRQPSVFHEQSKLQSNIEADD